MDRCWWAMGLVTEKGTLQKSEGQVVKVIRSPRVRLWRCGGLSAAGGAGVSAALSSQGGRGGMCLWEWR